jgi:hypothetical protein
MQSLRQVLLVTWLVQKLIIPCRFFLEVLLRILNAALHFSMFAHWDEGKQTRDQFHDRRLFLALKGRVMR